MFLYLVMVMYAVKLGVHAQNTTQPAVFADDTRGGSTRDNRHVRHQTGLTVQTTDRSDRSDNRRSNRSDNGQFRQQKFRQQIDCIGTDNTWASSRSTDNISEIEGTWYPSTSILQRNDVDVDQAGSALAVLMRVACYDLMPDNMCTNTPCIKLCTGHSPLRKGGVMVLGGVIGELDTRQHYCPVVSGRCFVTVVLPFIQQPRSIAVKHENATAKLARDFLISMNLQDHRDRNRKETTAKPAALKVVATFLVVCDKCDYDKGYGYVRDPKDCNTYYQCVRDKGVYYTFHCPPGLVWDAQALACNWPYLVPSCSNPPDPCKFMAPDPSNPYGYKKLVSGTWLVKECPLGEMYDPHTCTCVPDPCYNREYHPSNPNAYKQYVNGKWVVKWCAFKQIYNRDTCTCVADPCLEKKAHPANTHVYLEYEHSKWIVRPCAPGTAYNETSCNCDIHSRVPFIPVCKPVLYLPLYYNTEDVAHDHHVDNHGVYIHNDIPAAVWDGSSSLSVPYFRNGYYGDELTISFYYFRFDNVTRVVVSNSLCDGVEATVYIIVVPDGVCFYVKNNYGNTFVMCVPCPGATGWSFAMLKIHGGKMIGVTGKEYRVRDFYGKIPPTKCPLSIGKGLQHPSYYGKIVQFVVYVGCNPHQYKRASDLLKQGSVNAALVGTTSPPPVIE
ncbi:uncharacterized protein [Haliotis cracherodii]|uniref:uncharacterized protein n=1 Tax=Haliotis cracherodii TaxID=6455 RepID=UPI0039E7B539